MCSLQEGAIPAHQVADYNEYSQNPNLPILALCAYGKALPRIVTLSGTERLREKQCSKRSDCPPPPNKNKTRKHCAPVQRLSWAPAVLAESGFNHGLKELRWQALKTPIVFILPSDLIVGRPRARLSAPLGPTDSSLAQIWSWAKFTSRMTRPALYGCWEGTRLSLQSLLKT